ncbi:MAG TPA: CBS domain-containing protein [Patescibacteria group bacterium]|nr:CBS domain-containing protein [Patescibacteria group bacterium]
MERGTRLLRTIATPALLVGGLVLFFLGNAIGGLALFMAAWFARAAIRARQREDDLARLIQGLTVGEVMETEPLVVAPQATLDTFAPALGAAGGATVARVMRGDELLGLVGPQEVDRVPRGRWQAVRAAEAMVASDRLPHLDPGEPLGPAADRLGASAVPGLPVVSGGRLAGILTRLAVGRALHEQAEAGTAHRVRR